MMKKFLAVLLAVLMLGAVCLGVLAAPGDVVSQVKVGIALPVEGQKPEAALAENIVVKAKNAQGEEVTLVHGEDWKLVRTVWITGSGDTVKELEGEDVFVKGKSYQVKVRIRFLNDAYTIDNDTVITINGKTATFTAETVPAEPDEPVTEPSTEPTTGNEPTTGEGNEPTTGEGNEPTTGEGNEPTTGEGNEPTTGEGNEPATGEGNEPTTGEGNEPTTGEGNEPTTGEGNEPTTGEGNEPTTGEGNEPTTGEGNEPTTGEGNEPSTEPTTPPQGTDAAERVEPRTETWNVYDLHTNFFCTPADITPIVAQLHADETVKTYDGVGILLSAELADYVTGVDYQYSWYLEDQKIEGENGRTILIKDVKQSGAYRCVVTAKVMYDELREPMQGESAVKQMTIRPSKITIRLDNVEKVVQDPDPALTYTVEGEVYDELVGAPERLAGEEIGKYSIMIGTLAFPEAVAENYDVTVVLGTFSIVTEGNLTMTPVTDVADLSYILGEQSSTIKVSANKGAIPEGAVISLSTAGQDPLTALENLTGKKILKSFSVALLDATGKPIAMPVAAVLRFSIPLSAREVEEQVINTITAGFYSNSAKDLSVRLATEGGVNYLVVDIEQTGVVALLEGTKKQVTPPPTSSTTTTTAPTTTTQSVVGNLSDPTVTTTVKGGGSDTSFLWILVILLTLISLAVMIFTLVWTHHNRPSQSQTPPKVIFAAPPPQKGASQGARPAGTARSAAPTARSTAPTARSTAPTARSTAPTAGAQPRPTPTARRTPDFSKAPDQDIAALTKAVGNVSAASAVAKEKPAPRTIQPENVTTVHLEDEVLTEGEKQRMRRIADEINAMPPAPGVERKKEPEAPSKKPNPPVIFFDDLED